MTLGAQLFTIRVYTQSEKDLDYSLEEIAKIGYKSIQISAIGSSIKPKTVRKLCDNHGLSIVITHTDANRILHDTESVIEEHNILGCSYIGLGAMPERYRSPEWIEHFAMDLKEVAIKLKKQECCFLSYRRGKEVYKEKY